MKYIPALLLSLYFPTVFGQSSYIPFTRTLTKGGYQLGIGGEYFKTSNRIDKDGEKVELDEGEEFSRLQGEVFAAYGVTPKLQLGAGARYRRNQSVFLNAQGDEVTATGSGLQSTLLNITYAFDPVDRLHYAFEGSYRYVPYTNEENSTDEEVMVLGDEGNETSIGLAMSYYSRSNNFLSGRVAFRRPGKDLASEVFWQAEGALAWKHVALLAGIEGVSSLRNDPYEDDAASRPVFNTGTTFLYNSSNREIISPYVGLNFAFGPNWRMELKGSQVVSGKSTDLGTTFGVQLIRRVEKKTSNTTDKNFKSYDVEATISKVSPKKGYVVIDKGLNDGVQKGLSFDFYEFDYVGGNALVARGTVIQTKASSSVVKITQKFNSKKEMKEGLIARAAIK